MFVVRGALVVLAAALIAVSNTERHQVLLHMIYFVLLN